MLSDPELTRLALRRTALHARIAQRRLDCADALDQAARPLEWVDRGWQQWRRISPWLKVSAVPVGLLLSRGLLGRRHGVRRLMQWIPVAASLARAGLAFYRPRRQTSHSSPPPTFSP
jgi:hypothetical protein